MRNSPGKRFLTLLPILSALPRHTPSISYSPPKLLVFPPADEHLFGG